MDLLAEVKKRLNERLLSDKRYYGDGRVAFKMKLTEIEEALSQGHTAKSIWQDLRETENFPIQYRTFAEYVRRYVVNKEPLPKLGRPFKSKKNI